MYVGGRRKQANQLSPTMLITKCWKLPFCSKLYLVFFRNKQRFRCHRAMLRAPCAGLMSLFHRHRYNFLTPPLKKAPPAPSYKHYRNICSPAEILNNSSKGSCLILSPQRLFSPDAVPPLPPPAASSMWGRAEGGQWAQPALQSELLGFPLLPVSFPKKRKDRKVSSYHSWGGAKKKIN